MMASRWDSFDVNLLQESKLIFFFLDVFSTLKRMASNVPFYSWKYKSVYSTIQAAANEASLYRQDQVQEVKIQDAPPNITSLLGNVLLEWYATQAFFYVDIGKVPTGSNANLRSLIPPKKSQTQKQLKTFPPSKLHFTLIIVASI